MIGIFGGTFNPVHYGHLRTAVEIKQRFALEQVRLVPCANPPHRETPAVDGAMRLQMLQLAVAQCPGLIADGCEVVRNGPSYSVHTLSDMRDLWPDKPLLLFMGMDAFAGLPRWYQWQRLFDFAHIVVIARPGFSLPSLLPELAARQTESATELAASTAGRLFFQAVTQLEISATAIRNMFASGQDAHFLLPDNVLDYIYQHRLYL